MAADSNNDAMLCRS